MKSAFIFVMLRGDTPRNPLLGHEFNQRPSQDRKVKQLRTSVLVDGVLGGIILLRIGTLAVRRPDGLAPSGVTRIMTIGNSLLKERGKGIVSFLILPLVVVVRLLKRERVVGKRKVSRGRMVPTGVEPPTRRRSPTFQHLP